MNGDLQYLVTVSLLEPTRRSRATKRRALQPPPDERSDAEQREARLNSFQLRNCNGNGVRGGPPARPDRLSNQGSTLADSDFETHKTWSDAKNVLQSDCRW